MIAAAIKFVFDRAKWIDGHFATGRGEGVGSRENGGAATASGYEGKVRGADERLSTCDSEVGTRRL